LPVTPSDNRGRKSTKKNSFAKSFAQNDEKAKRSSNSECQ